MTPDQTNKLTRSERAARVVMKRELRRLVHEVRLRKLTHEEKDQLIRLSKMLGQLQH
jgi:hypothetical protein